MTQQYCVKAVSYSGECYQLWYTGKSAEECVDQARKDNEWAVRCFV